MRVELDTFAKWCIEARLGSNLRVGVLDAVLHYTRRLRSGRRPGPPPRFPLGGRDEGGEGVALELQLGPQTQAALKGQAEEHGLPLNRVMAHAVYVYLADLERSSESDLAPTQCPA